MCCDVVAGEQGPSCFSTKQIPDYKVIHVRFVERPDASQALEPEAIQSTSNPKKRRLQSLLQPWY